MIRVPPEGAGGRGCWMWWHWCVQWDVRGQEGDQIPRSIQQALAQCLLWARLWESSGEQAEVSWLWSLQFRGLINTQTRTALFRKGLGGWDSAEWELGNSWGWGKQRGD